MPECGVLVPHSFGPRIVIGCKFLTQRGIAPVFRFSIEKDVMKDFRDPCGFLTQPAAAMKMCISSQTYAACLSNVTLSANEAKGNEGAPHLHSHLRCRVQVGRSDLPATNLNVSDLQ